MLEGPLRRRQLVPSADPLRTDGVPPTGKERRRFSYRSDHHAACARKWWRKSAQKSGEYEAAVAASSKDRKDRK
jgi:hypothetical protein